MKYLNLLINNKINLENLTTAILEQCDTITTLDGTNHELNRKNVGEALEFLSNRKSALKPFKEDLKRYKKGEYQEWNIELGLEYVTRDIGYYLWWIKNKN